MVDLEECRWAALLALVGPEMLDLIQWWANLNEYESVRPAILAILAVGLSDHYDEDDADDFEDEDILSVVEAYAKEMGMAPRQALAELLFEGLEGA